MYITINKEKFDYREKEDFSDLYNYAAYSVEDFYARPSSSKISAERSLLKKMDSFDGYGYGVSGGNTCTFSAFWFFQLDGVEFLVKETAQNSYLYGPKTKTIADQIEEVRRERRKQKRALKEYQRKRAEEVESFRVFISGVYEDLKDIMADNYKDLYKIIEAEAFEYCEDLNIIKPWFAEAAEILNQYKTE